MIIDQISLLTQLPKEWGFNSRGLKPICSDSSSWTFGIQVENSMKSRRNSQSIPLQLRRNRVKTRGDHEEVEIFLKICLIHFTNRSKVKRKEGTIHPFSRRFWPENSGRLMRRGSGLMATIVRRSWSIIWSGRGSPFFAEWATIVPWSSDNRASIVVLRPSWSTVRWRSCDEDLRHRVFAMNLVSFIRWGSDAPCASTRRQMIGKSTSLKSNFAHVRWWMIAWTRVHAIDASPLDPTLALVPRHLQEKNLWEHSPTRNKKQEM